MYIGELFEDIQRPIPRDIAWTAKSYASSVRSGDYFIAWVDVDKIARSWKNDGNYVGPRGEGGIKGRYERFDQFVRTGVPIEVPYIGFSFGHVSFGNGRHRFSWMRDHGAKAVPVVLSTEYKDKIKPFLSRTRRTVLTRGLKEDVFHGTPFRFDRFSTDRVNTGEKAQSFGWGLYFAGEADVANFYRDKLSTDEDGRALGILLDDKVVSARTPQSQLTAEERAALDIYLNRMNVDRAVAELKDGLRYLEQNSPVYRLDIATLKALKTIDFTGRIKPYFGAFYHVEIPDSEDYLYWDRPLTKQPEKVRAALSALGVAIADHPVCVWQEAGNAWEYGFVSGGQFIARLSVQETPEGFGVFRPDGSAQGKLIDVYATPKDAKTQAERLVPREITSVTLTGESAYRALQKKLGSDKAASLALLDRGIPGIKYKDQHSRRLGEDEASFNYVIFDDRSVTIKAVRAYAS